MTTETDGAGSAADALFSDGAPDPQSGAQGGVQDGQTGQQTQAQQGAQGGAEGASWLDSIDDPELKGWAQNKAFPSVKDALASARNLEGLLGREKLPMPKDESDKEGYDRVFKALGRPDDASGYALDKIEGAEPGFATAAATKFHEIGLSSKQGQALAEFWQQAQTQAAADVEAQYKQRSASEMADWMKEAGPNKDALMEQARRAVRSFGLKQEAVGAIERGMGTKDFMAFMAKVGGAFAEDTFEGSDSQRGFGMTVEQAIARRNALTADKEWSKSYLAGDTNKRAEMERLNRVISASQGQAA